MVCYTEDDDPIARQKALDPTNARMVRALGTSLLKEAISSALTRVVAGHGMPAAPTTPSAKTMTPGVTAADS